ncbi:MAG: aminodeoxychorismate lyase [Gammaproteobacteria bacterium]|nr:aminodeoxychorismate lyase [Gammaproteobacteria bacterium]
MLINGQPASELSALDRGLMYGDGHFTTIAVRGGRAELWEQHLWRLENACERLRMSMPDAGLLAAERDRLVAGVEQGVLRLTLTRGVGGRGYRPAEDAQTTRILSLHPWPDYSAFPDSGLRMRLCDTRLGVQPALASMKTLNRLEQVLARAEWRDPAVHEGLMLDTEDRVVAATQANLFFVQDGRLCTPELTRCGVSGIMRRHISTLALAEGVDLRVGDFSLAELMNADEVFLCNSLIRIWPVAQIDSRNYPWGSLTRRLQKLVAQSLPT